TILANNWQNADGTVTIYAKGKDSAGNEITVQKKVVSLDLDKPKTPVISSNSGYPILTSYGVVYDATTTITYDTRTDIDNYYSIDNGVNWSKYTGSFDYPSGTVMAKSIKKTTGLEVVTSKTLAMPSDAITPNGYDKNYTTYSANNTKAVMKVDSSMIGKNIKMKILFSGGEYSAGYIQFLNSSKTVISQITVGIHYSATYDASTTIPANTTEINLVCSTIYTYEIESLNEPTITATNGYMLIHPDDSKAIKNPYQMVSISYFPTSVQRLYRIGSSGDWSSYQDQPIKLNSGLTIYTKGIDQYGNETRIVSSYTSNVPDAVGSLAVDRNYNTYSTNSTKATIKVDPTAIGKKVRIKLTFSGGEYSAGYIQFLDSSKAVISQTTVSIHYSAGYDNVVTIPANTAEICLLSTTIYTYEIELANEPTFGISTEYMLLHTNASKSIKAPSQLITINYFPTSVQKLYRIGTTGDWLNYQDQPVKLASGLTIYAKGIDQYGNETRITSSYTANIVDAIGALSGDRDYNTYSTNSTKGIIKVDPSMIGKKVRIKLTFYGGEYSSGYIQFLDSSKNLISQIVVGIHYSAGYDNIVTIPANTAEIDLISTTINTYEIELVNEPTFTVSTIYMLLHADDSKAIKAPSQLVTINYFPTSVQKLYSLDAGTTWLNYPNESIKLSSGSTIYAKGIDQYGNVTRLTSSYTANIVDAIGAQAYDGNITTYASNSTKGIIQIDPSMIGKKVRIKSTFYGAEYSTGYIQFLNSSKTLISQIAVGIHYSAGYDNIVTIPANTTEINLLSTTIYTYEIAVSQ
ncbi:MAG: hypothetical protein K0R72_998, partial [Clostridia bacterium]|nr:hypothetical protein [Clostridia bacterium]